eukprot:2236644-Lingulodinium_polyedra.AAC.1
MRSRAHCQPQCTGNHACCMFSIIPCCLLTVSVCVLGQGARACGDMRMMLVFRTVEALEIQCACKVLSA